MRPAVFLDRDDTLMEASGLPAPSPPAAPGDVVDPDQVRLLPGAAEGCRVLAELGLALVVFSNQGVVARGGATCARVDEINARMREELEAAAGWDAERGKLIEAFYYCPWHPVGTIPEYTREHEWRKPAPGMIRAAAQDLGLDLKRSWVIGDAPRDIAAGLAAGIDPERCLRVGPRGAWATVLDAAREVRRRLERL
jgi:D-glycero-D-manno-heptose 1,7-bisphosphate phosphatase